MAVYPSTLPMPQKGISITPGNTNVIRETISGRKEIRRMGSGAPDKATVTFRFTWNEWATFKTFFDSTLNLGLNWFSADWIPSLGYSDHKARILGYPKVRATQKYFVDVSATLIIQVNADITTTDTQWPS
jgi:hypothetical protein